MPMSELELTGRVRTHVVDVPEPACIVHKAAAGPFLALREAAGQAGIDLIPVSAFRDFSAQLRIWNEKFTGRRPLYDRAGHPLEAARLTPGQIVDAILCWSAVPGASRHHWGSEIDVIDRAALAPGQPVRLLSAEYAPDGPFARLTAWLDRHMEDFDFFRPYRTDRGGVAPEPWHLSYAPVSLEAGGQLTVELLQRTLMETEIEGKEFLLERLADIHSRYVLNVDPPVPPRY